jgi:hypothetical protein
MKLFAFTIVVASIFIGSFGSCKSSDQPAAFCDTACLNDTLKFSGNHPLKPYVYLTVRDCKPDSLIWSYSGMGTNRMTGFENMIGTTIHMNKDFVKCYIRDTAYAWLLFNDCISGRGFQLKLPYSKQGSFSLKSSGINGFDKKFSVQESLVVNTDRGNIYVEDMQTGKKAMMTFGEKVDIDYDDIHQHIDSVNVTDSRIWVKVKIGETWKELEKNIKLE